MRRCTPRPGTRCCSVALRRVEGVKQLVHALAVEAPAVIPHRDAHTIAVVRFGSDQHLARAIRELLQGGAPATTKPGMKVFPYFATPNTELQTVAQSIELAALPTRYGR